MSTVFEKRLATLAQAQCNYLRTIGGNESDSVGMKEVRLDAGDGQESGWLVHFGD